MVTAVSTQQRALIANMGEVPSWLENESLSSFYNLAVEQVTFDQNDNPACGLPADAERVLRGGARLEQEIVRRGMNKKPVIISNQPYFMEDLAKARNIEY